MNWVVKLERIDDAGNLQSTIIGYVERPDLASEADLGLTHDEGKCLIRRLQAEIAQNQVEALIAKARPCPCCRRLRSVKEHRRRQIDTMFGHLRIHAPRFEACACGRSAASSPVASLMICRDARHSIARFEGCAGSGSVFRHSLDRHSQSPSRCFSRAIEIGASDETSPGDVQRARTATDRPLAAWRPRRRRGP